MGAWFAQRGNFAILSSPLARAAETAEIVASASPGRPGIRLEPLLAELDAGPFTGLSFEEAALLHPEAHAGFLRESWDGVPGAEASIELYARAVRAWESLREAAIGGADSIVAFTHGGFLQWLLKATFGTRGWMPLFPMSNCGVSELVVNPRSEGILLTWRRIDYRPPGVAALASPLF